MNISRRFIDYPVMTTLVMAAHRDLRPRRLHDAARQRAAERGFPDHQVSAELAGRRPRDDGVGGRGAARERVLDRARHRLDDLVEQPGLTNITLQFKLDRNIDAAAQDVQAAISAAVRQLPKTMMNPPTFRKENPADSPILFLALRRRRCRSRRSTATPRRCSRASSRRSTASRR